MRYLIILLILLVLSISLGLEMTRDTSYLLILYRYWSIETTLWVVVIFLFILFILFYIILRLLEYITHIAKTFRRWRKVKKNCLAHQLTIAGLYKFFEGYWQPAERELVKAAKMIKIPLVNYLVAARAATAQRAYERCDNYLRLARIKAKGSHLAIDLTQVRLQISKNQWKQALATLEHLNHTYPHHICILQLLKRVYLQLQDWLELRQLLPRLRKYRAESPEVIDSFEKTIYLNLITVAHHKGKHALIEMWYSFPHRFTKEVKLIDTYTRYLIKYGEIDKAISLIEATLKKKWNLHLVSTYGLVQGGKKSDQLATSETWLKKYPKEPELFLCLGRLSRREKFLGKALDYLKTSIKLAPSASAYRELGRIYEEQGQLASVLDCYRKALDLKNI